MTIVTNSCIAMKNSKNMQQTLTTRSAPPETRQKETPSNPIQNPRVASIRETDKKVFNPHFELHPSKIDLRKSEGNSPKIVREKK